MISHKQVQMQEEGWVSAQLFSSLFVTYLTMTAQVTRRRHTFKQVELRCFQCCYGNGDNNETQHYWCGDWLLVSLWSDWRIFGSFHDQFRRKVLKAAGLEGRTQVDMCVNERGWEEGAEGRKLWSWLLISEIKALTLLKEERKVKRGKRW